MTRERLRAGDGAFRFRFGHDEVTADKAADMRLPIVTEIEDGRLLAQRGVPGLRGRAGPERGWTRA